MTVGTLEFYTSSTAFTAPNLLTLMHVIHTALYISSFHIYIATTASAVGIPEATIKILRRWRSMAYQQYV